MNTLHIAIIVILLVIVGTSGVAFAQYTGTSSSPPLITVKTDSSHYDYGDTIIVSGNTINPRLEKITLRIFDPFNQLVIYSEFEPQSNGTFSKILLTVGPLFRNAGNYTLVVHQDSVTFSKTIFYFSGRTNPSGITEKIQSPLKQFKSGIAAKDVKCNDGFQRVIKSEDDHPACVKPSSVARLLQQGWMLEPYVDWGKK